MIDMNQIDTICNFRSYLMDKIDFFPFTETSVGRFYRSSLREIIIMILCKTVTSV